MRIGDLERLDNVVDNIAFIAEKIFQVTKSKADTDASTGTSSGQTSSLTVMIVFHQRSVEDQQRWHWLAGFG